MNTASYSGAIPNGWRAIGSTGREYRNDAEATEVYVQPGGCLEIRTDAQEIGEPDMVHICDPEVLVAIAEIWGILARPEEPK